jgi:hypothetical protein
MAEEVVNTQGQEDDNFFDQLEGKEKVEPVAEEKVVEKPVEETPVVEEKPVEEEVVEVKPEDELIKPVEFNIKDHFPEYEDIEGVKSALKKANEAIGDEELLSLRDKAEVADKYEKNFSSLKESGLSPELIRLQMAEKNDPEKAQLYKRLLYGDPTDLEMIKLDLINQYPELKEDSAMLDFQLKKKYPELYGPDAEPDSDEYKAELTGMKFDATQIKKKIKGEFESLEIPEYPNPDRAKEKVAETIQTWKPHFEGHKEELMTFDVSFKGKDGAEKLMDIKIPEDHAKQYTEAAVHYLADQNLHYSKANLQKVKDFVKGIYIGENLQAYNKAIFDKASEAVTETFRKGTHNPKGTDTKVKKAKDSDIDKKADAFFDAI